MTRLCGKGIWLTHSHDFDRAVEMTTRIGGTHLFVKTGHGPIYFLRQPVTWCSGFDP